MRHRVHLEPLGSSGRCWTATLRNGEAIQVRTVAPEDAEAEREFLQRLSAETRRRRFLEQFRTPSDALIHRLTHVDQLQDAAYVATATEGGREQIVAAARIASDRQRHEAECALVVRDDWQGKGLGELLLRHLVQAAAERGLTRLYSVDDSDNLDMADLAARLGFRRRADPGVPGQVVHELML